jgi:palmitoyltransferase
MTSLKKIQQGIMTMVNASPVALLVVLFTWSYWAYNYRMGWAQYINKGQAIQGIRGIYRIHQYHIDIIP